MKKIILSAIVALMGVVAPQTVSAQEAAQYVSESLGISVVVPDNMAAVSDDAEGLVLKSSDENFGIVIVPFDAENIKPEEMEATLNALSEGVALDQENAEDKQFASETLEGGFKMAALGNGLTMVGIAGKEGLPVGFFFTVTAGDGYIDWAQAFLENFNVVK